MSTTLFTAYRSSWKAYSDILETVFRRFYASSLGRPWINSPAAATADAIYRLSVGAAAPFIFALAILIGSVRSLFPNLLPGRLAGYLFAAGFVVVGLATYVALNRKFEGYEVPDESSREDRPLTRGEWWFGLASWASIVGYIALLVLCL